MSAAVYIHPLLQTASHTSATEDRKVDHMVGAVDLAVRQKSAPAPEGKELEHAWQPSSSETLQRSHTRVHGGVLKAGLSDMAAHLGSDMNPGIEVCSGVHTGSVSPEETQPCCLGPPLCLHGHSACAGNRRVRAPQIHFRYRCRPSSCGQPSAP